MSSSDVNFRKIKVDEELRIDSNKKNVYRDDDIYIYSPSDGVLDIVADTSVRINGSATYTNLIRLAPGNLGLPNTNPPTVSEQDNLSFLNFTVNTDRVMFAFPPPSDYAGGDLTIIAVWTNDGGVDDENKNVKVQIDYQVGSAGDVISGSHANSPKTIQDTYTSASGWVKHWTGNITIAAADFADEECVFLKLSFITPTGTALSCEPRLIEVCLSYTAYKNPA